MSPPPVTLLFASDLLPSAEDPVIENGGIAWQGGMILDVGDFAVLGARYPGARTIDCTGHFVMPGLINSHDHGRGIGTLPLGVPDEPLEVWLSGLFTLRPLDCYLTALYDGLNLIRSGVTTTVHQHNPRDWNRVEEELLESARGYRDAGIRATLGLPLLDQNILHYMGDAPYFESLPQSLASQLRQMGMGSKPVDWPAVSAAAGRLQQAWSAEGWSWYHWCPVGVQWCSDNLLVAIKQAAGDALIQIHMLETRYQQTYGQRKFGSTLVAHLAELGFLDKNVACAHSVWLTDNDIRLLADYQAMVIHNPSSNMRLRSGLCRVLDLLDAGVRVGIGLDGAGLNDDQDMFLEMRLVKGLAYEPGIDKRSLSARQVLSMATLNAADIVGGPGPKRGKLSAGYAADLITLKVERILSPYMDERADLVDVIFRRAGSGDVDTVVVNGELQMRAGKHLWKDVIAVADALKEQLSQPKSEGQQRQEQLAAELLPHLKALYSDW